MFWDCIWQVTESVYKMTHSHFTSMSEWAPSIWCSELVINFKVTLSDNARSCIFALIRVVFRSFPLVCKCERTITWNKIYLKAPVYPKYGSLELSEQRLSPSPLHKAHRLVLDASRDGVAAPGAQLYTSKRRHLVNKVSKRILLSDNVGSNILSIYLLPKKAETSFRRLPLSVTVICPFLIRVAIGTSHPAVRPTPVWQEFLPTRWMQNCCS